MKMTDYIPEYEKQTGKPAGTIVVRFAEGMDRICEKAEHNGMEDAGKCKPACAVDLFRERIRKTLCDDQQLVDDVAELIHEAYMKGYSAGKAAV